MNTAQILRCAAIVFAASAASTAAAQELSSIHGASNFDQMGWSVGSVGDVDGDGVPDWIAGTPYEATNGPSAGVARVVSGANGAVLRTVLGSAPFDYFGWSVAGVGDMNLDGFPDFACGAPEDDNNGAESGSVRVFSGDAGNPLSMTLNGTAAGDLFGTSVSGAGDVNGDGLLDLIVGAPNGSPNGVQSGYARVFVGPVVTLLATIDNGGAGEAFGASVAGAGDVNDDGFDDVIVGDPLADSMFGDTGGATVHSGEWITKNALLQVPDSLPIVFSMLGDSLFDQFGAAVAGGGDVDGDGFTDVIIGAPFDDPNGSSSGSVVVVGGPAGAVLRFLPGQNGGDVFGTAVAAGDANGDGFADVFVGAPEDDGAASNTGSARVVSGKDGSPIRFLAGTQGGDQLGHAVSVAGDVDGDGMDDLVVGVIGADPAGISSGSARLYASQPGAITSYGAGCAGSFGIFPVLSVTGASTPTGILTIGIDDAFGGSFAALLTGTGKAAIPIDMTGCTLNVQTILAIAIPIPLSAGGPGAGSVSFEVAVPAGVPPGAAGTLQAFAADPGVPRGWSNTKGVEIVVE